MNYNYKLNAFEIWSAITDNPIESTSLSNWSAQSQHAPNILIAKELFQHTDSELVNYRGGQHGMDKFDTLFDLVMMKKNKFLFSVLIDRGLFLENLPKASGFMNKHKNVLLKNNHEIYKGHTVESFFYESLYSTSKEYRTHLHKIDLINKGYNQPSMNEEVMNVLYAMSWFDFFNKVDKNDSDIKKIYQHFIDDYVAPYWNKILFNHVNTFLNMKYLNELPNFNLPLDIKNKNNQTLLDLYLLDKYHNYKINTHIEEETVKHLLSINLDFQEYPTTLKEHIVLAMLKDNYANSHKTAFLLLPHCKHLEQIKDEALNIMNDNKKHFNSQNIEMFIACVEKNKLENITNNNIGNKKIKL
jgi:hypothetical protein